MAAILAPLTVLSKRPSNRSEGRLRHCPGLLAACRCVGRHAIQLPGRRLRHPRRSRPLAGPNGPESEAKRATGPEAADLINYYLVNEVAHCGDCHTPQDGRGRPDPARCLRGPTLPFRHKKETEDWSGRSPDITSRGLAGEWGEAGMIKFLTTGVNPDRRSPRRRCRSFACTPGTPTRSIYTSDLYPARERAGTPRREQRTRSDRETHGLWLSRVGGVPHGLWASRSSPPPAPPTIQDLRTRG